MDEVIESIATGSATDNTSYGATYIDGRDAIPALATMQPGQQFEQIWTVRNSGSAAWDDSIQLTWVGGKPLSPTFYVPVASCAPGDEVTINVPFTAPTEPGPHYSIWRMADERGEPFGERVWLLINVIDPHAEEPAQVYGMSQPTERNVRPATTPSPSQPTERLPDQSATQTSSASHNDSTSGHPVRDPELYAAWKRHIEHGFANNQLMFQQLLNGFMNPYWTTVWMYRILFGLGVASFLVAAGLSAFANKEGYTLVFGGLSALSLLAYFFNRPLQALEENLQFITWLGLIYNSYWTRLVYLNSQPDVQKELQDATDDAIQRIQELMDAHAKRSSKRETLKP